jgi:hypothetical protein
MGLIVHDNVEIPNFPLSVSRADCHLTIRGSYTIRKITKWDDTIAYNIESAIYWYENTGSNKVITVQPYSKEITEVSLDLYSLIYNDIASRYTSTELYQPISQV